MNNRTEPKLTYLTVGTYYFTFLTPPPPTSTKIAYMLQKFKLVVIFKPINKAF